MKSALLFSKALFSLLAVATAASNVKVEHLDSVPQGWEKDSTPDPSTTIKFWLAIHDQNPGQLHERTLDISTPGHPLYGSHLKRDELKNMVRADAGTTKKLTTWLTDAGVASDAIHDDADYIQFNADVKTAETLLATRFYNYKNKASGTSKLRTLEYSVPESVAPFVDMIQPTTLFGGLKRHKTTIYQPFTTDQSEENTLATPIEGEECVDYFTPKCLRELYGLGDLIAENTAENRIGVSGYLEQYAQYDDLDSFVEKYAPYAEGATFSEGLIDGGKNTQHDPADSVEANLDMQYVVGLSYNISVTYYSTAGRGPLIPDKTQPNISDNSNEPYLEQLRYLVNLDDDKLPTVLTTSYGESEWSLPVPYMKKTCDLFAQLGARGVSVIFSSGDDGPGSACETNDGKNTTRFESSYPATCPFVTAIGGTVGTGPERAVNFSSGGFSDTFERPKYQEKAVKAYLGDLGDRWDGLYNNKGRGFPDIAAQGRYYAVYDKGQLRAVSGTSASAPTIAAIISQLNGVRFAKGKKSLGFLNPWIYSKGLKGFTDIVDGGSQGCTGTDRGSGLPAKYVPYASWNATKGWDPVTGFGTPNFKELVDLMP